MVDSLGWRSKFAVIAPSTNTSVQPEFEAMRPRGVTNHHSRIIIPDTKIFDDDSFMVMMDNIRAGTLDAIDAVMSMSPDCVVMGMSAETFWEGDEGAGRFMANCMARTNGVPMVMGSTAIVAALNAYGGVKKLGIVTPYMPVADVQVRRFFEDNGYEVVHIKGLKSSSPMMIAHESPEILARAAQEVSVGVDAVVQCGTNLAFAAVAAQAELMLDMPVVAINTATYWHALRTMGIEDRMDGFGKLLSEY